MGLILQIDTATEHAGVSLSIDGELIQEKKNSNQKDHAAFVQPAIKLLLKEANTDLKSLDAVSVISGPGSYTGVRVGMASAKGLCFACDIPLLLINTLEAMALSSIQQTRQIEKFQVMPQLLFAPMIDARRTEVFTAVYDERLNIIFPPSAVVLDEFSFKELLEDHPVIFSGNGATKFKKMLQHQNLYVTEILIDGSAFSILSDAALRSGSFADLAYSEPDYLKMFHFST